MKILIDECLDWRICRSLSDDYCLSVHKAGWAGLKNGELLERAQLEFDAFITSDRNLAFQQNTSKFTIAIIVLCARSTRLKVTLKLMPQVAEALRTIQPGAVVHVFDEQEAQRLIFVSAPQLHFNRPRILRIVTLRPVRNVDSIQPIRLRRDSEPNGQRQPTHRS